MILRGSLNDYSDLPHAADAFCVIEVADSSYERDAGEKLFGYARAGILQYIIMNLRNSMAEVYTAPNPAEGTYAARLIVSVEGKLPLRAGDDDFFEVPLLELLP